MKYEFKGQNGPWILGGCSGRMITTPDGYVGDGFIADVDTLDNARLIAAAPDLLESLVRAVEHIDATNNGYDDHDPRRIIPIWYEPARSAIHKALNIKP